MRNNVIILASIACGTMIAGEPSRPKKFYADDPVWTMPQPAAVRNAHNRQLSEYYDFFENTLFEPGDRAPRKGMSLPSLGINTVDEVPDSAWYTNRHAGRRLTRRSHATHCHRRRRLVGARDRRRLHHRTADGVVIRLLPPRADLR